MAGEQLDFMEQLFPAPKVCGKTYRIADIPIRKPKPYQPDPWDRLAQDFEDVNLAEERARILKQGKYE
jgi:hypothetical protein